MPGPLSPFSSSLQGSSPQTAFPAGPLNISWTPDGEPPEPYSMLGKVILVTLLQGLMTVLCSRLTSYISRNMSKTSFQTDRRQNFPKWLLWILAPSTATFSVSIWEILLLYFLSQRLALPSSILNGMKNSEVGKSGFIQPSRVLNSFELTLNSMERCFAVNII